MQQSEGLLNSLLVENTEKERNEKTNNTEKKMHCRVNDNKTIGSSGENTKS